MDDSYERNKNNSKKDTNNTNKNEVSLTVKDDQNHNSGRKLNNNGNINNNKFNNNTSNNNFAEISFDSNNSYNNYNKHNNKTDLLLQYNYNNSYITLMKKIVPAFIFVFLLISLNTTDFKFFTSTVNCFNDQGFNYSESLHAYMVKHPKFQDTIMIIAGLAEDFAVVLGFICFCYLFPSWRLVIGLCCVYFLRFIMQNIYVMAIPKQSTFRDSGFPSLFVPYLPTNDYFFSGHVSLPSIVGFEFWKNNYRKTSMFCYSVAIYQTFMMISVRGHYSIDLYAGYLFSFYCCTLSNIFRRHVDPSFSWSYKNEKQQHISSVRN